MTVRPLTLKDPSLLKDKCYVAGEWVGGAERIAVTNPVDDSVVGYVPKLGAAETRRALEAAETAQKAWAKKPAKERAGILRKWFDLMMANQEDLAQIMTAEQGKPLAESRGEIAYGASFVEFFAEEGKRIYGETIPSPWPTARMVVIKQPLGVVAAITPWNFPNAMITRKAGPALAAGCAFVCKPAAETPLSALALAELAERAGIPAGVFSILTGKSGEIGVEMTSNPIVRGLTFTGSTEIGRLLYAQCAPTIKKLGLELAAMRRSSCSTTPTSTRRFRARWRPNTATPGRPASAPTGCWCRRASMTPSPPSSRKLWRSSRLAMARKQGSPPAR